jgi:hypothetical protein
MRCGSKRGPRKPPGSPKILRPLPWSRLLLAADMSIQDSCFATNPPLQGRSQKQLKNPRRVPFRNNDLSLNDSYCRERG